MNDQDKQQRSSPINSGTVNTSLATTSSLNLTEISKEVFSEGSSGVNADAFIWINPKYHQNSYIGDIDIVSEIVNKIREEKKISFRKKQYSIKFSKGKLLTAAEVLGKFVGSVIREAKKE